MPRTTDEPKLPEGSLRILARIAQYMRDHETVRIELDLHDGGVRDCREIRKLRPVDLERSNGDPF